MEIIWLCNQSIPAVCELTHDIVSVYGGWLSDMSERILETGKHSLTILYPNIRCSNGNKENLSFYEFNEGNCFDLFCKVIKMHNPDVIHIWGTEFRHTLEMMRACECLNIVNRTVISIQGLISICARHFYTGIPERIANHKTLHEFFRGGNIKDGQKNFKKRGEAEIKSLILVKNVIGRTDFDKACTLQINPDLKYYFCGETLREEFYHKAWDLKRVKPHSIFVSQSNYPIKGFHYVLEAANILKKEFPDVHVYTTGPDIRELAKRRLYVSTYTQYLCSLVSKYELDENVTFLGILNAEQMCQQYLNANVFVSASTVENSPNSVGEAMLVGCPVVSSDVGGVQSILQHEIEGFLYPSDAPYMLAYYITRIFNENELAQKISENARARARRNYDSVQNYANLLAIYSDIKQKWSVDS